MACEQKAGRRACLQRQQAQPSILLPLWPAVSQERYTCPSLALHPREPVFLAQTNGNYLALFSAVWPYRMSRRRRYEGHKVPLPCHALHPQKAEHWPQSLPPHRANNGLGVREHRPLSSRFCFLLPK